MAKAKGTETSARSASSRGPTAAWAVPGLSARRTSEWRSGPQAASVLAALEASLEALGVPALIVGPRGDVVCANCAGRAVIAREPSTARMRALDPRAPGASQQRWDVTPIRSKGATGWSLLIFRAPSVTPSTRWKLTARQSEVLSLVAHGMTNTSIAETLGIRLGTVEFHISAIFDKVGVNSRAALIASLMEL